MTIDTHAVAATAAALIERHGWTQGDYIDECGALCVAGAIHEAMAPGTALDMSDSEIDVAAAIGDYLRLDWATDDNPVSRLATWNDQWDRTPGHTSIIAKRNPCYDTENPS